MPVHLGPVNKDTMLTFLPYPDFKQTAKVLDEKRLQQQVVEAKILLDWVLEGKPERLNLPQVAMWKTSPRLLAEYGVEVSVEWGRRFNKTHVYLQGFMEKMIDLGTGPPPDWLGAEKLHASHRRALYLKDPVKYGLFMSDRIGLNCCLDHMVWWPTCRSPKS